MLKTSAAAAFALFAQTKSADAAGKALGYGLSEKDANAQLAGYGLKGMDKVLDHNQRNHIRVEECKILHNCPLLHVEWDRRGH